MKHLAFLWLFLLTTTITQAQMITWSWDLYSIQFAVPSDFKVTQNDKKGFAAGNSHINLTIYPQANPGQDINVMNAALEKWATSAKLTFTTKAQEMGVPLNGFKACFLDATASNGLPTTVMFLSNPNDPATGYYVWFQAQKEYSVQVGEMMLSLAPHSKGMTEWTWEEYKVKYKAPSDFKVIRNDKEGFSASNEFINLSIYPDHSKTHDRLDMAMSLENWASNNSLSYDGFAQELTDLNRYWGYYIDGVSSSGKPTTILLLADPDYPEIGLYVWLQYTSDKVAEASKIARSFMPK